MTKDQLLDAICKTHEDFTRDWYARRIDEYTESIIATTRRETVEEFWYLANHETDKYYFPALRIVTFEILNTVKDKLLDQLPDKQEG